MAKPANNMAIGIQNMSVRFDNMAQTRINLAFGHELKLLPGEKLVSMNRLSYKWGDILEM
ncbi:MAG: hypothetical protein KKF57_09405 [Firmicutes bacterium]|nr:hypothetical protein [Bacillota bacterium]